MHHHPHRKARPDDVGRLDIQRPSHDLLADLVETLRAAGTQRLGDAVAATDVGFRADTEHGRHQGGLEYLAPMIVGLILQSSEARRIGRRLILQHDRVPGPPHQPGPDQQHPLLAISDLGVIATDQCRALRDQQDMPGRTVIDILRDLRRDFARQVRADAGDQRTGNDRC